MGLGVARTALLLGAMWLLGRLGGPLWACVGVGLGFGGYALAGLAMAARIGGVSATAVLAGLAPPLVACAPLVAAVLAARFGMRMLGVQGPVLLVGVELLVGATAFVAAALVTAPTLSREFLRVIGTTLFRVRARAVQA